MLRGLIDDDDDYVDNRKHAAVKNIEQAQKLSAEEIAKRALKERLSTSEGRFWWRIETWQNKKGSAVQHHFWWFVHNCISHPLIGVLPGHKTFKFHDYTSDKINCK